MHDLVTVGDPTIDTLVSIHDAEIRCELKKKDKCMMCIEYGDKIPVDFIQQKTAGNAMNVAVGGSRLGLKTAFYGIVGADMQGTLIREALVKDRVDIRYLNFDSKSATNASTVINFNNERTILVFHAERKYHLPKMTAARWMYYTSVGKNHKDLNKEIIDFVKKNKVKLAYNPGTHQMLEGASEVKKVAAQCEIMFINVQEGERIFGDGGGVPELLHKMHKVGVKIAVITDGKKGSYASDGHSAFFMPIYPYPAIERTGAGDAYATGFMSALAWGQDMVSAMKWGSANSTGVVQKIGPQDGLMTRAQVEAFIKNKKCRAVVPTPLS